LLGWQPDGQLVVPHQYEGVLPVQFGVLPPW